MHLFSETGWHPLVKVKSDMFRYSFVENVSQYQSFAQK